MTMRVNITREHGWFTAKDWAWEFVMKDDDGVVVDITGWTFAFVVKPIGATDTTAPLFAELSGASVPVVDGPTGTFRVIGTAALTTAAGIGNKNYQHEIRRTNTGDVRVVAEGEAYLRQSLTA